MGGLDAVEFFESIAGLIPESDRDKYEQAMNRIKYEAAKGVGVKIKTTKAIYKWHKDIENCGHCGYSGVRAHESYCPNCGTAYLRNQYTEKKAIRFEECHQITIEELIKGGGK